MELTCVQVAEQAARRTAHVRNVLTPICTLCFFRSPLLSLLAFLSHSPSPRVPLSLPFSLRSPLTPRAQLQSIEASSEDEGQDDPSSPRADSPRSDSETAPAAPTAKSREMEILEEAMAAAESSLAGLQDDLHSAQVLLECGAWRMALGACLHSLEPPRHTPL